MPELTEAQLGQAIRSVSSRIKPLSIEEVVLRSSDDDLGSSQKVGIEPASDSLLRRPSRYWLASLSAAAVILAGLLLLSTKDDSRIDATDPSGSTTSTTTDSDRTDSAGPTDPTEEIANRFARTFEALDADAAQELISASPTEILLTLRGGSIEEQFLAWEAVGGQVQLQDCEALPRPGLARCLLLVEDKVTRVHGLEPLELSIGIVVEDGLVDTARFDLDLYRRWTQKAWPLYAEWVAAHRPDEVAVVYPNGLPGLAEVMDPEVRAIYTQLVDDYVRDGGRGRLTENQP